MQSVLNRYLDKIIKDNSTIDARGVMQVNRMIELTMDEVFINLSVRTGRQEKLGPMYTIPSNFVQATSTIYDTQFSKGLIAGTLYSTSPGVLSYYVPPGITSTLIAPGVISSSVASSAISFMNERLAPSLETGVSVDDLWARHNAWVLLGDPGAGKTTLLKHYALDSARKYKAGSGHLPVLLPLRLFAAEWEQQPTWAPQNAVLNYLADKGLSEIGFEQALERKELLDIFKRALSDGRALFLFDGLDEQRNANMQRKSVAAIESLLQRHTGNRFLVSSRIIGYDAAPLGSNFNTATLEPFNDEQMEAFFHQWIYAVEKNEDIVVDDSTKKRAEEKADDLIAQVKNNTGIRALATNPLLCTIIGLIRRQGATLPQLRAELYKLCIDTFIFNWELQKRRRVDQQGSLNKDQTQAVLEELALYFHEHCPENRASQQSITDIIRKFLIQQEGLTVEDAAHKAGQLLSLIRDVSGLLIDRGNNEYGFFHLTFQEYLTARAITRRRKDIDRYLRQHLFEPRWREVIRLAAAHQGMKDEETGSEFIEAIRHCPHKHEAEMHYAFRLAFLCLKEARVELETWNRMFSEWVRLYLEQPELGGLLLQLLWHTGANVRYHSASLQPLLAALKDEDRDVRSSAVVALARIKYPATIPTLLTVLKDEDSNVRSSAVNALSEFKDPAVVPALLAALKDEDRSVRSNAAYSLSNIKDPAVLPALLGALKDGDRSVRNGAIYALGTIKDPAILPALLGALKDEDIGVRYGTVRALGKIKDPATVPALLAALKDEDSSVRSSAVSALSEFKDPAVVPALLAALKDEDSTVRRNAVSALSKTKDPTVMPALLATLNDEDSDVRIKVASALSENKDPAAMSVLLAALKDENSVVRIRAASALSEIKDPAAMPVLLAALKDEDSTVRGRAVYALGETEDPAVIPALVAALKDEASDVRMGAVYALSETKDPAIVPALLALLKDEDSDVRSSTVYALSETKDPAIVPALLALLKDKDSYVRWAVTNAIEKIELGAELCPD